MVTRYINQSHKDPGCCREAEIIGVCGDFGYCTKQEVHDHIKLKGYTYYSRNLNARNVPDAQVHPRGEGPNRYIQTNADNHSANNLVNLPNCRP